MSSLIERFRRLGVGSDPPLGATRRDVAAERVNRALEARQNRAIDDAVVVRSERVYGKPLSVTTEQRIAETLNSALQSIRSAREEQYRLADESEDLAESAILKGLGVQSKAQSTEISRIAETATINGTALFSDTPLDLSVTDISRNINSSTILPTSTSVTASSEISFITPELARSRKALAEQRLAELSAFSAGVSSIVKDISSLIRKADPERLRAKAEAKAESEEQPIDPTLLASAIGSQIADPYSTERARQMLIEKSTTKTESASAQKRSETEEKS